MTTIDNTNNYYFFKTFGFCTCCTFNYKIYVVKAKDENDLRKILLENEIVKNKILEISQCSCEEDEKDCKKYFTPSVTLSFFEQKNNLPLSEFNNYYSNVDILKELTNENNKQNEENVEYLGNEAEAKKYLLKEYSQTPDGEEPQEGEKSLGQILFNGERIYEDLSCTEYGKEKLN